MGKIKTTLIKRTARELSQRLESISPEFEGNKKILGNTMPSKKLRNKIAGYLVRIEKQRQKHAQSLSA